MSEETAVAETPDVDRSEPQAEPETSPGEHRTVEDVTKWNHWVHVGEGAEDCDDGENGRCKVAEHFHAFCRLPNPLQIKEVRDKANAAKARTIRRLRDPESDAWVILETDMQTLREVADEDALIAEILGRRRFEDNFRATKEVSEREEFEGIEDDQRRFRALDSQQPGERDEDEYNELLRQLERWTEAVEEARQELQRPERESLEALDNEQLIAMIREERIKAEANEAWMDAYSLWEWYLGTLKPRDPAKGLPCERMFSDFEQFRVMPRDQYEAIEKAFTMLEQSPVSSRAQTSVSAEGNS